MKYLFIFYFLILLTNISLAQNSKLLKEKQEWERQLKEYKSSDDSCVFTNQYSTFQRTKMYPFSKAHVILAVSYEAKMADANVEIRITDSLGNILKSPKAIDTVKKAGLSIRKGKLDYSTLIETRTLSKIQIDSLSNLIFNISYNKPGFNQVGHGACFFPRNAILFLNAKGKVFDYIQICFDCHNYESKTRKSSMGDACEQKFELFRRFFRQLAINHGTEEEIHKEILEQNVGSEEKAN